MAQKVPTGDTTDFTNVHEVVMLADAVTGEPYSAENPVPVTFAVGPDSPPSLVYQSFIVTVAGTGYAVGDFLIQIDEWDISTTPPTWKSTVWRNITTGVTLVTPPPPTSVSPIAGSASSVVVTNFPATQAVSIASLPLPAGAATVAAQNSQTALLAQIEFNAAPGGFAVTPASAAVTSSSAIVVAANAARKRMVITNLGTVPVFIGDAQPAVMNSGIVLFPNGVWVMDPYTFTIYPIHAICSGSSTLAIQEYQ